MITIKQAIQNIIDIKSMYTWSTGADEALDMAISVLQAQDSPKPTAGSVQNVQNEDLISRKAAIDAIEKNTYRHTYLDQIIDIVSELPSAQPTLFGYDIEHLILIANVLRKENLPPERITEVITDIGRIVSIVRDEFTEKLLKAVEQCEI